MRQPLDKALRKKLEETVIKARDIVEAAVKESLQRLGVAESQAPSYLKDNEKVLRNKLRAHARQLGDRLSDGKQEITRLANEMAYEHWHRMLFARFLEQSNLLMYDPQTPVTLDECFELAEEEDDCKDGWELAGRLAQKMLPQIFRADSPVFEVKLSMNRVDELESLISKLDPQTYQAQDSLGWCYQFWQSKKKEEVNKSGVKIGAQELSPVTQLFTEPYMVSFLLDNALGAWWANKRLSRDDLIRANNEQELRDLASIPGVPLEYLRFIQDKDESGNAIRWKPAAGGFEKWPEHLSELKTLDPCCGSGHFLVAIFLMLVPMRMELEGLTEKQAIDAVLRDNIHGLELDQRCVELAAFALALEAWRYPNAGGYRTLPELQLACSGISIAEAQKEWKDLAKGNEDLTNAIIDMQRIFKDAPTLGSLIEPSKALKVGELPPWELLQHKLINMLDTNIDAKVIAKGLCKAASVVSNSYDFIVTNPPYLGRGKQAPLLQNFCDKNYYNSKSELAFTFVERFIKQLRSNGLISIVAPQSWLHQPSYKSLRIKLINEHEFGLFSPLGSNAFESISGEVVNVGLFSFFNRKKLDNTHFNTISVSERKSPQEKCQALRVDPNSTFQQISFLKTPENIIVLHELGEGDYMSEFADSLAGINCGDSPRFQRFFAEVSLFNTKWKLQQAASSSTNMHSGCYTVFPWGDKDYTNFVESLNGRLGGSWRRGEGAWNKKGIAVNRMGELYSTIYGGYIFDQNIAVISPKEESNLVPLFTYIESDNFRQDVRKVNPNLAVSNSVLSQVHFDINFWSEKGRKRFPKGLPKPYTGDPAQWIFHGHPCASVVWDEELKTTSVGNLRQDDNVLQVTVARLLSYQWPAEFNTEMELAPEMREVIKRNADFADLVDDDGIVCIPAVRGEKSAAKRLEAMLIKAYGDAWDSSVETNLLKAVKAKDLESWLRDKFFEQHCKLFQHRPFIWHIWDGLKDGFSALLNYHKLDYKGLERLIYTYLDDWISNQKRQLAEGTDGADIRLTAAENLKVQLIAILEGEEGLDIFVRWKPLEEQPIGWNPDLNDGVRLNIRPFMLAKDVGKKGAGVLRAKPNIHWKKDRGTDVESAPWYNLGLEYGGKQGDRINEHHLSLSVKREARMKLKEAD